MTKAVITIALALAALLAAPVQDEPTQVVIAHRGASAYAPENTIEAARLAVEQQADYVEIDILFTKDGHLVAMHDTSLERTTDVAEVFADRGRPADDGTGERRWPVEDLTLDEIRRLDAGRWFDPHFAGTRVPTLEELLDAVLPDAGLLIELKFPDRARAAGRRMEARVAEALRARGLATGARDARWPPVIVQSFDEGGVRELARLLPDVPRVLLFSPPAAPRWTSEDGLADVAAFASGIGPNKAILDEDPGLVARARRHGLFVFAWTYRAESPAAHERVRREMRDAFHTLELDGVITDNPDLARPLP